MNAEKLERLNELNREIEHIKTFIERSDPKHEMTKDFSKLDIAIGHFGIMPKTKLEIDGNVVDTNSVVKYLRRKALKRLRELEYEFKKL